jgi:hypothetical protein
MTLWCHFCDVSRYGTYVACLAMSMRWLKSTSSNRVHDRKNNSGSVRPETARLLREETYRYVNADGSLGSGRITGPTGNDAQLASKGQVTY